MNALPYCTNRLRYFTLFFHKSRDDWNRYFNDPPTVINTDGSKQFLKSDPNGKYFVTDCNFGDLKTKCISVESVGPNYLGISETEFNKCSADDHCPCTVFRNGSFFQYRVTGKDCTTRLTHNGIHTSVLARQNSYDLNLIEESSISGYSSETSGSVLWHKNGNVSFVSINESNCKTRYAVGYLIYNDASGTSSTKFCQFISNKADLMCYWHWYSQHYIHCSNYLNSSSSSTASQPGIINLASANSQIYISNSVMKDNSGKILLYSTESSSDIIADKCFLDNQKIEMITSGNGDIELNNNNIISLCILVKIKYKTILQNKFCRCKSNNNLYLIAFLTTQ
ncbi:hypothetical protein TVAG_399210 [Trichomonas vaginalis G3]|uniref:Uncharacterized protein n=1 Tax=Trichomonas vaginalis (strain ATCC PRA-98 / G3) TaxID=412133 RepID=A2E5V9_TRIV3|nr:hypothetical protein TVAGG3_0337890 [Trichomonas vaginalis G3]EAY11916.1 hypothetical protein TVAG_399210 [Trichomonas vaginalis G3]KAI5530417.1 hypothetical protein TVAGG3_0337890 [Trichomonas vaginalis G3]|eukprot:XP_001324139.1 hypothetical protein [Trichomonas vaginalis G3]